MRRVLFIARYRNLTMHRKVDYLAADGDTELLLITPADWRDELLSVKQENRHGRYRQVVLSMHGRPNDPHRSVYHTLDFVMRSFRPHIIHAEEEPDSLSALQIAWARRLFAPKARLLLHTWQNIDRPKSMAVQWVMERTLAAADLVFCANQEAAAILRRRGYQRPLPVIPAVGVDTEIFVPCPARPPNATAPPIIGYIGRFVPEKGIDILLHAFARLRQTGASPVRLRLIGDGSERENLMKLAVALGIQEDVEFWSPLPPVEIASAICALDMLVLPSRTTSIWKEQLGRVLLEAMACGVPVIGSDSGAIPEVIGDAGLIFPEGDMAALSQILVELIQRPALRHALGERGRLRVEERYSQRRLAEATLAVYDGLGL